MWSLGKGGHNGSDDTGEGGFGATGGDIRFLTGNVTVNRTKRKLSLTSYITPNFSLVKNILSIIHIVGIEAVLY